MKLTLIIIAAILAFVLLVVFIIQASRNTAITLEETVTTAKSDIEVQLHRRVNLLTELAECVARYDKHEAETLKNVIAQRGSSMTDNEAGEIALQIKAVAEQYPDLKAEKNYGKFMVELSTTENLVANHKKAYNEAVREYRRHCRSFPANMFLSMLGYEMQEFAYYTSEATDKTPIKLFKD